MKAWQKDVAKGRKFFTQYQIIMRKAWCPRRDSNSHDVTIGGF